MIINMLAQKTSSQQKQIIFVTNKICPFAHRTWITLQQLNIPYLMKELPIFQNNSELKAIYIKALAHDPKSNGKVPFILAESTLTVEYLYKKYGKNRTANISPELAIKAKIFAKENRKIIVQFYKFRDWHSMNQQDKKQTICKLNDDLKELNQNLQLPYALGQNFTEADIMLYPWVARWVAIQKHIGVSIDKKFVNIKKWVHNLQQRSSFSKTKGLDEFYSKGYQSYFLKPKL